MTGWPTVPVHLNHLEAMGIAIALYAEEQRDGLSQPQLDAKEQIEGALSSLLGALVQPPDDVD